MSTKKTDWAALKLAFITDPSKPSLRDFCVTHDLPYGTAKNRSSKEDWVTERDRHWGKVTQTAEEKIVNLQATVQARDITQQLSHIQRMKDHALKYAGADPEHAIPYEKPDAAVAAYERLVKLERLLLEQSTEIISVNDGRQLVREVLTILTEEVTDDDLFTRISQRLATLGNLRGGIAEPPEGQTALN